MLESIKKTLENLPTTPGVYIYRNSQQEIIYVGKAINLKRRVNQYWQRDDALGPKTKLLVAQVATIETINLDSEIEALITEASLIKKYLPKYNSQLRDDRSYLYICITKDTLPRIFPAHRANIPPGVLWYGPFPDGGSVRRLLNVLRRIFPFYGLKAHPPRECLYCHLNLCPGPNPDPKLYRRNIGYVKKILSGNFTYLVRRWEKEMKASVKTQDFETALIIRNQLFSFNYIISGWHHLNKLYSSVNLHDDLASRATHELISVLSPYFKLTAIDKIEGFDISNLGAKYFSGSQVVWETGIMDRAQYRHYRVNTKISQDDQFMIREVLYRRLKNPQWPYPDLFLVDGGKPQVSAATQALELAQIHIPVIGLAKKEELVVIKTRKGFEEVRLPKHSQALLLLESIRNEAHRFANRYRRLQAAKINQL
jgi:excinuclease ABC subunit C